MIIIIIALVIGLGIETFFLCRKQILDKQELDTLNIQKQALVIENNSWRQSRDDLQKDVTKAADDLLKIKQQIEEVKAQKGLIDNQMEEYYQSKYAEISHILSDNFERATEKEREKYLTQSDEAKKVYLECLTALKDEYSTAEEHLQQINLQLSEEENKTKNLVAANAREEAKKLENNKYKLTISDADLLEIKALNEVKTLLRNKRAISKAIWENYYRTPTSELITRIIGTGTHIGIYRITNLLNGKSYIGQSVNLGERWKQHIKCGLGIDTPANNLLYQAMQHDGVENFTFEVLEECAQSKLNEQEVYWIACYDSQNYGYNMSKGGA